MVSVVLASYNGELFIREQIISILKQLNPSDQLVVVDDASTDNTSSVVLGMSDTRILFIQNTSNWGVVRSFNEGLKNATGDFIFLADQDDIWLDGRVNKLLNVLKNCDLVYSNSYIVDQDLVSHNITLFDTLTISDNILYNLYKNCFVGCHLAFNRRVLKEILPIPSSFPMHDSWIGLLSLFYFKVHFFNEPTMLFRRHKCNNSTTGSRSNALLSKKLLQRKIMIIELLKKFLNNIFAFCK